MIPVLDDASLPAGYRSADEASLAGQRDALRQVRWTLRLGILAAAGGLTTWRVGAAELDVLAGLAAIAFATSLLLTLKLAADRADERWYRGRAVAESIKTLAWRYAVGGDPFPVTMKPVDADRFLVDRIAEIVEEAAPLQFVPIVAHQITPRMRELRAEELSIRRQSYSVGRVDDQMHWYASKASANGASARSWGRVVVVANIVGLLGAAARFLGWIDVDLLGVAAAGTAAATAWIQVKQHRVLASSYALAAQELSLVRETLLGVADEKEWSLEMSDAEEAISREHTMWLARHRYSV